MLTCPERKKLASALAQLIRDRAELAAYATAHPEAEALVAYPDLEIADDLSQLLESLP